MKGYIDEWGRLFIKRPGVKKEDTIPCQCAHDRSRPCSHMCVSFGEPEYNFLENQVMINICDGKTLVFDEYEFEDKRK